MKDFSKSFIEATKDENTRVMLHYLKINQYLVYEYDEVNSC